MNVRFTCVDLYKRSWTFGVLLRYYDHRLIAAAIAAVMTTGCNRSGAMDQPLPSLVVAVIAVIAAIAVMAVFAVIAVMAVIAVIAAIAVFAAIAAVLEVMAVIAAIAEN